MRAAHDGEHPLRGLGVARGALLARAHNVGVRLGHQPFHIEAAATDEATDSNVGDEHLERDERHAIGEIADGADHAVTDQRIREVGIG